MLLLFKVIPTFNYLLHCYLHSTLRAEHFNNIYVFFSYENSKLGWSMLMSIPGMFIYGMLIECLDIDRKSFS